MFTIFVQLFKSSQLYIKYFDLIQIICTQLNGFKYFYQILKMYLHLYGFSNYLYLMIIICLKSSGFMYFYPIQIIFKQIYLYANYCTQTSFYSVYNLKNLFIRIHYFYRWIYFNSTSTYIGLFCAKNLGNWVHCKFLFKFSFSCFLRVFFHTIFI